MCGLLMAFLVLGALATFDNPVFAEEPEKKEEEVDWGTLFIMHYHNRVDLFRKENAELDKDSYIVFLGDSITEGFPLQEHFPDKNVLNRGIGADGIGFERGILNRMNESVLDCSPETIFLLIGVNDLPIEERTPKACLEKYRTLVERILSEVPKVKLVLQTLLPVGTKYQAHKFLNPRIMEFNEGIRNLAKEKNLPLLDLHVLYRDENGLLPEKVSEDGLHLIPEAYKIWSEEAKELMIK